MTWGYLKCFCWILKRSMSILKIPWDSHLHQKIRSFRGVYLEGLTCYSNIILKYSPQIRTVHIENLGWPFIPVRKMEASTKRGEFWLWARSWELKVSFSIIVEIWNYHRFIAFDSKPLFVTPRNARFVAKKPGFFTTCPSNKARIWRIWVVGIRAGWFMMIFWWIIACSLKWATKKHQKNMCDTWLGCIPIL